MLASVSVVAALAGDLTAATAAPVGTIETYAATSIHSPAGITTGPDGNMWFTNSATDTIGRITATGTVDSFTGAGIDGPNDVTTGPDGNLWFTNYANSTIGRITPSGSVTNFTGSTISYPYEIAAGADGALWFTNKGGDSIGRITTAGVVTRYLGLGISLPSGIAAGPDGNMWFTNQNNNRIGRITPTGTVTTFTATGVENPYAIAAGRDGNLWFTNWSASPSIGRITPTGAISLFTAAGVSGPTDISAGPDGNLWFANYGNNSIGRIDSLGGIATFANTGPGQPWSIAGGPDGDVWFTNLGDNSIGKITAVAGSYFHPLNPTRLLDSRGPTGGWGTPLTAGTPRQLQVTGGVLAIPKSATAVVLNVTVTRGTANSFLTVFPAGEPVPKASNLNFAPGQTAPNLVTVKVGAGGKVAFSNAIGAVDVVADIQGYFAPIAADRYTPKTPARLLDSRTPTGGWDAPLVAGSPRSLQVRGVAGIPAGADAVILNVTVTGGSANSFLTSFPTGSSVPTASNLNFAAGQTVANLVMAKIGAGGQVSFANASGAVDVVVDVAGYFDVAAGSLFHPLTPARVLDSRTTVGGWNAKLAAGAPRSLVATASGGVGAGATALIANTTVTESTANSFLTVLPSGAAVMTSASNLNFAAGQTTANLVAATVGPTGGFTFRTAVGSTHVVFDVAGYFASS
jgi:streptogramin lyase